MCSACPLCNSPGVSGNLVKQLTYYWCESCDYIFLDPGQRLTPEREKARYEEHNNSMEEPGYVKFLQAFLDGTVAPYLRPGMRILDYGCGPGPVLAELIRRAGFAAEVYDPFFSPTPPTGTYDLITCTEVLEHAYDPGALWTNLIKHLAAGGYICVMTRFHPGIGDFPGWWYHRDATHVVFYSQKTLEVIERLYPLRLVQTDSFDKAVFQRV
jgi:SAM-dependent methyltransferase